MQVQFPTRFPGMAVDTWLWNTLQISSLSSFFGVEINLKLSAEDLPICTVDADYFRIDNLSLLFISILKMYFIT